MERGIFQVSFAGSSLTLRASTTPTITGPGLTKDIGQHIGLHLALLYSREQYGAPVQDFDSILAALDHAIITRRDYEDRVFWSALIARRQKLTGRAMNMVRNAAIVEDLVQETLLRAWRYRHQFEAGTNLDAWLFTILRNQCMSHHRQRQREVEDVDDLQAHAQISLPNQEFRLTLRDLDRALQALPGPMREAFVCVAVHGMSSEAVAARMGCRVGTVKSRVCRARDRLAAVLEDRPIDGDAATSDRPRARPRYNR